MSKPLTLAIVMLAAACGPNTPKPEPIVKVTPPDAAVIEEPPMSTYDAAVAEVARLQQVADQDPLLQAWTGSYGGVPPWDRLDAAKFPGAFTTGLALLAAEISVVAENADAPTFQNTFVPLQNAGRYEDRAETLWSVMTSSLKTEDVQAVDREWAPQIAAAYDAIVFNDKLFARIKAIHDAPGGLDAEQQRLVDRTYDRYIQAGAQLSADQKAQMGAINQELAVLFTDFETKVTNDENTWTVIDAEADLAGIPDDLRASYKSAAEERGLTGKWAVVNTRSSVDPFLTQSARRNLRETVWQKFKNRGDNGDANDTNATIARIVKLRAERAALLGYASHADWRMADTMAQSPANADALMLRVWPAAVARVKEEVKDMQKLARKEKGNAKLTIEPWDYLYYAEKVRKQKYDLDSAALKPYFQLDNMIQGAFYMAGELYGLAFSEITGTVPVFHPDVRVWEVTDKATGDHVGLFYGDYFARAGKRSGAWASGYRGHETFTGTTIHTITSNNNNFVRAGKDDPVLITLDDAETLFHEFGHALHALLSEVNYPGLGGTPRDFVEYPSQVHEMWVLSRPILDQFCKHVETGKTLPQAMIAKIEKSSKFNQGYETVAYLSSAIVDMKLHTLPDGVVDADAFERDTMKEIGAPKEIAMRHRLPQFLHLFSSDSYSAGYYSYLWSEVMDADTREAFAEAGDVFDKGVAAKLRKFILAPGNSTDRAEAYRQFRGRDPDVKALLKKRGFPTK